MKSITCRAAHLLVLAAALVGPTSPARAQPSYAITVLDGLNSAGSNLARAINNAGSVVGFSTTLDISTQQYRRSAWLLPSGSSAPLGFDPPAAYSATTFTDINANGVVTGFNYNINQSYPHGNSVFTWSPSTGLQTLYTPASAYASHVSNINDAGHSVGRIESTFLVYSAVTWDSAGNASPLPATPIGPAIFGNDINNNGQMLVTGSDGTTRRDYLWNGQTGYTVLVKAPGFKETGGVALNEAGRAVGFAANDLSRPNGHASFWPEPGRVVDLGVLPDDTMSLASSINAFDVVVGTSSGTSLGVADHAFLWSEGTGMVDLLSLLDPNDPLLGRISNSSAHDINDAGQIVGSLFLDGVKKGFVMTPVPEPATAALWLAGLLMMFAVCRRRLAGNECLTSTWAVRTSLHPPTLRGSDPWAAAPNRH